MLNLRFLIFATIWVAISCQYWLNPKPCQSGDDCGKNECCSIGYVRFSVPVCKPLGEENDWCYQENEPVNRTLSYPNGASETFINVYRNFCPCSSRHTCKQNTCFKKPIEDISDELNYFESFSEIF